MSTGLRPKMMVDPSVGKNAVVRQPRVKSRVVVQDPLAVAVVVWVLLFDHMVALVGAWKDFADLGKET